MSSYDSILWMAGSDWWVHNTYSEKRYARIYAAEGTTVLFVNTISIGLPSLATRGVLGRILRRLGSAARALRQVDDRLWVLTPVLLPVWSSAAITRINTALLVLQLRLAMRRAGMKRPAGVFAIPTAAILLGRLSLQGIVYYVKDKYAAYHENMAFSRAAEHDAALLRAADLLACASKGLHDEYATEYPVVRWVPHGASAQFFDVRDDSEPEELAAIPHPRITFWGLLDIQVDETLLRGIALARPDWHIVLVGPKTYDFPVLRGVSNVHFLPPAPQEDLIRVGLHSDVLMNCRKDTDWNRYACPTKLREYLALGRPVVSVPVHDMERAFPGAAHVAVGRDAWIAAITRALAEDTEEDRARRRALVAGYDVSAAANRFRAVVDEAAALHEARTTR